MSDLQHSRSLKRPALSQSGRPKRMALPNSFTNTANTRPFSQLTVDMASSPSYMGNSFTNTSYTGGPVSFGGVAMTPNPSQMSQASYQLSAHGSPSSPVQFYQRQPYLGDSQASPLSDDDSNLLNPADYLQSRSYESSGSAFLPGQGQYLDVGYSSFDTSELHSQIASTAASSSFGPATGLLEELPSQINLDAPRMVHIHSQNSLEDPLLDLSMDISHGSIKLDTPADDGIRGNVSLHMALPTQWPSDHFIPLDRTMTVGSFNGQDQSQIQAKLDNEADEVYSAPPMERNGSSNRSQSQRMREAATRHLSNADKNLILPKDIPYTPHNTRADVAGSAAHRLSIPKNSMICSGKREITKTRRERPPHKRLFCEECPKDTKGFRGPHELQRHITRHHEAQRKRYICVDPRLKGAQTSLTVYKSLESCKRCSGNKMYGADYNAAAHLRRAHFKPHVPRTKGRSQPVQDDSSSSPAMEDLKGWIVEITLPQHNSQTGQSPASEVTQSIGSLGMDFLFPEDEGELDQNEQHNEQQYMLGSDLPFQPSQDQFNLSGYHDETLSAPRNMGNDIIFPFDEDFDLDQFSQDLLHTQAPSDEPGASLF